MQSPTPCARRPILLAVKVRLASHLLPERRTPISQKCPVAGSTTVPARRFRGVIDYVGMVLVEKA